MTDQPPIQHLPETGSDERAHELSAQCWCNPTTEYIQARGHLHHHRP